MKAFSSKINTLLNTVKYRWKVAPTWVKMLDILCWTTLLLLLVNYI